MSILGWIFIGLIAGGFARMVTGGGWNMGCIGTVLVGVAGGLIGGALFNWAGDEGITGFNLWSMFVAFIGAVLLLAVVALITGQNRHERRGY